MLFRSKLFTKVLGISKAALANDEADWHMLYSGYSWWFSTSWECNLYEATFKKGEGKKGNRHDVTYSKPTKDMHQIVLDAKNGSKVGCVSGEFFDEDHKIRWYARYKKGSELGGGMYGTQTPSAAAQTSMSITSISIMKHRVACTT